jgi:competence protein ComEA
MWKDWLAFSRKEQYGIIFFSVLIVLFAAGRVLYSLFNDTPENGLDLDAADVIEFNQDKIDGNENTTINKESDSGTQNLYPEPFNPNKINVTKLHKMGLSPFVIVNWMKYREAGGYFSDAHDIAKVYGLDTLLAKQLEPYVDFNLDESSFYDTQSHPEKHLHSQNKTQSGKNDVAKKLTEFEARNEKELADTSYNFEIDINHADALDFQRLSGIGEVFSQRIVDFRNLLGGFYTVEQLKEVYGISPDLFENIRPYLFVSGDGIRKFDINKASLRRLRNHPYFNFYQARDIIELRRNKGVINRPGLLDSISSFNPEELSKALPYLSFDTVKENEKQQKIEN